MKPVSNFRKWATLPVLSLALAIIIIDTTILNVSLSAIIKDFNTDIQSIQWVVTAYSLTLAALMITGGRLGDLWGRKRMFMMGAVIFAIGSTITALSVNVPMMIAGEAIIEGVGAALMMPATASLLVANFKGRERAIAFGVWGGIAAASSAVGPILGGFLTTNYNWRWGFGVNVIVVLVLLLGSLLIPESKDTEEKPSLDIIGVVLSVLGLLPLVFGVIEASQYGWFYSKEVLTIGSVALDFGKYSFVPLSILTGIFFLVLFLLWEIYMEKKGKTPLVSLELFQNRQFSSGVVTTLILSLGQTGLIFSIPVFLQSVHGLDAYHTGLSLLPLSLTALVVAPLSGFLTGKINTKYLIQFGLLLNAVAFLILRSEMSVSATAADLTPGFIVFGAGMGMVMAQISNLTLSAVSVEEAGEASGVNNTFRQLGATLGSAIIGSILLTSLATNLTAGINNSNVIPISLKPTLVEAVSKQTSNVEFGGGARLSGKVLPAISNELTTISHQATTDANKEALLIGFGILLLGFLMSFSLPSVKNVERGQSAAHH